MKCLVAVKRVIDFNVKIRVKLDGSGVDTEHVKMSMNPFDEIALEEAVRLKEAGTVSEILAVSVGNESCQETLRAALARGADRALLVKVGSYIEPLNVAKILKSIVEQEQCSLVWLGKQAIDDDCNQTGQMLAGLLGWAQGTNVSKVTFKADTTDKTDNNSNLLIVEVTREIDGGLEVLNLQLPAVLTADLRLNTPRYISLPNVMKAKSKPLTVVSAAELSDSALDLNPHTKTLKVEAPKMHRTGVMVKDVQELVEKLKNEAKVL